MNRFNKYLVLLALTFSIIGYAGKINKAFEALEIFNYFEAKRLFEKAEKKQAVPAKFGLCIIYARNDNPFSNLDSAYNKITSCVEQFEALDFRDKLKYEKKYALDSVLIWRQRDHVSELYFERAIQVNSIFGFQDFIDKVPWSPDLDSAVYMRDNLAFEQAVLSGKSDDYKTFLSNYPGSEFTMEATNKFHKTQYVEQTYSNNFIDYVNFVRSNPDSPYRDDAEDMIFKISTKTGTIEAFRNFIIEFPSNRNVKTAWKRLYNVKMQEIYSSKSIKEFSDDYPDYPFKSDLLKEMNMADKVFYPVKNERGWGYSDKAANLVVDFRFESVEWFSEGLAAVKKDGKYGYINKLGSIVVNPKFDDALPFNEGFAVVEKDELWGLIDRNGEFIVSPTYEDLGVVNEGLFYYQEETYYGFYDTKGIVRLQPQFSEAYDFENGLAVVSKNDYFGLIDLFGTTYIPFKYENLRKYADSAYAAKMNDYWGIINLGGDTLLNFEYDFIGEPKSGYSIVEKDDEFNFINENFEFVFQDWIETYPEYKQMAMFRNGYAKLEYEKGFNLCDTLGNRLFQREAQDVGFYSSLIAMKKKDKWGYVDKKGYKKIEFEYDFAQSFKNETAIVKADPFYGLINTAGDKIIEPIQEELYFMNDSVLVAKRYGRYALLAVTGDTLLNYQYINIEPIDASVVRIEEGEEVFYYNIENNIFIRKEE